MSQEQTLQDLYVKIADIKDVLCELTVKSSIVYQIEVQDDSRQVPYLNIDNPNGTQLIQDVEDSINSIFRAAYDITIQSGTELEINAQTGEIVELPSDSPLRWLPKLIGIIVGSKAPIGIILNIVVDFLKEVLLEQIKKELSKKRASLAAGGLITISSIVVVPKEAKSIVFEFFSIPEWFGKKIVRANLNTSVIQPEEQEQTDVAKRLVSALGTVVIGTQFNDDAENKIVFWEEELKLEYVKQIVPISNYESATNLNRYAYIDLENEVSCTYAFLKV